MKMNATDSHKTFGVTLYVVSASCVVAGTVLSFSGSLKLGGVLIVVGISTAISGAIRLGHLKKW